MTVELSVTIKDDERKFTKDFLIYQEFVMNEQDALIAQYVKECINEFKGEPEHIIVKTKMVLK